MNKRKIGSDGEIKAENLLNSNGFRTICKNYRSKLGEIDIIAEKENLIIFVEVKYRLNTKYGFGEESIDIKKGRKIYITAIDFIQNNSKYSNFDFRFDAIIINNYDIRWIKNIFWGDDVGF